MGKPTHPPLNVCQLSNPPWALDSNDGFFRWKKWIGLDMLHGGNIVFTIMICITHDGSMGRTVYLPCIDPIKINEIHVCGLVPWILWVMVVPPLRNHKGSTPSHQRNHLQQHSNYKNTRFNRHILKWSEFHWFAGIREVVFVVCSSVMAHLRLALFP